MDDIYLTFPILLDFIMKLAVVLGVANNGMSYQLDKGISTIYSIFIREY